MAPTVPPTPGPANDKNDFPLGGIIGLCVGGYLIIVFVIMLIRHLMKAKDIECCEGTTCCTGLTCGCCSNDDGSNTCLLNCAQACDCKPPSKAECLDCACPTREWCDEKCCCCMSAEPNGQCCADCQGPECGCGDCCDCRCQCSTPDSINCLCCEMKLR